MQFLLRNATIIDPNSAHNGKTIDLLIEDGTITKIGNALTATGAKEIKYDGLHVSPGWMDLQAHLCDPGYEHRETLETAAAAAAAGGFTAVVAMPDTNPVLQNKSGIEYIIRRSALLPVDIIPSGALSVNLEGKQMTELYDMYRAGARAFTDGLHSVTHSGLLVRILQYTANFGGRVHVMNDERTLSVSGQMHEGVMSTTLGLKGIPVLAEEVHVVRNLYLAEYAGAPIHFMALTSAKSVELVREAKKKGLQVTAAVHAAHLFWTDDALADFDTNYKLSPPLRSKEHQQALIVGLADGTIDCITSGHLPEDSEAKVVEFDLAHPGMIALEHAFALARTATPQLPLHQLIQALAIRPREIAGTAIPKIEVGEFANITLFAPDEKYIASLDNLRSKSKNTPISGTQLRGKVLGIIHKSKLVQ
jgi:dihydroorotase